MMKAHDLRNWAQRQPAGKCHDCLGSRNPFGTTLTTKCIAQSNWSTHPSLCFPKTSPILMTRSVKRWNARGCSSNFRGRRCSTVSADGHGWCGASVHEYRWVYTDMFLSDGTLKRKATWKNKSFHIENSSIQGQNVTGTEDGSLVGKLAAIMTACESLHTIITPFRFHRNSRFSNTRLASDGVFWRQWKSATCVESEVARRLGREAWPQIENSSLNQRKRCSRTV